MKRKNRIIVLGLLLLICIVGIGYATLTTTLNINGTAQVNVPTWDVHFDNLSVTSGSVTGSQVTTAAAIDTAKTSISYSVSLNTPGDYYEFTVDVVNGGSLDAKISNVPAVAGITTEQDVYTNYTITYSDGTAVAQNDTLTAGSTKTLTVKVEYDKDITSDKLPTTNQTLNLTFPLTYVQA